MKIKGYLKIQVAFFSGCLKSKQLPLRQCVLDTLAGNIKVFRLALDADKAPTALQCCCHHIRARTKRRVLFIYRIGHHAPIRLPLGQVVALGVGYFCQSCIFFRAVSE